VSSKKESNKLGKVSNCDFICCRMILKGEKIGEEENGEGKVEKGSKEEDEDSGSFQEPRKDRIDEICCLRYLS